MSHQHGVPFPRRMTLLEQVCGPRVGVVTAPWEAPDSSARLSSTAFPPQQKSDIIATYHWEFVVHRNQTPVQRHCRRPWQEHPQMGIPIQQTLVCSLCPSFMNYDNTNNILGAPNIVSPQQLLTAAWRPSHLLVRHSENTRKPDNGDDPARQS